MLYINYIPEYYAPSRPGHGQPGPKIPSLARPGYATGLVSGMNFEPDGWVGSCSDLHFSCGRARPAGLTVGSGRVGLGPFFSASGFF